MCQPKGFKDGDWRIFVWLMLQSIYGLKQSALEWYEQVCAVMADLGFTKVELDHAPFYYDKLDQAVNAVCTHCLIGWHIDNGMAVSNSHPFLEKVKRRIADRFGITDLGPVMKYLDVQFERDHKRCKVWMHQLEYISLLQGMAYLTATQFVSQLIPKHHSVTHPSCILMLQTYNLPTWNLLESWSIFSQYSSRHLLHCQCACSA